MMRPSRAAILFSGTSPKELASLLTEVMTTKRYVSTITPLPKGYPSYQGEWLGFIVAENPKNNLCALIPNDVTYVFNVALWIAQTRPKQSFCAWQRLQGLDPVLKYYSQGRPQLRDGVDRDLEVTWSIPSELPVDVTEPSEFGLPSQAQSFESFFGRTIEPYSAHSNPPVEDEIMLAFLDRRSPIA